MAKMKLIKNPNIACSFMKSKCMKWSCLLFIIHEPHQQETICSLSIGRNIACNVHGLACPCHDAPNGNYKQQAVQANFPPALFENSPSSLYPPRAYRSLQSKLFSWLQLRTSVWMSDDLTPITDVSLLNCHLRYSCIHESAAA